MYCTVYIYTISPQIAQVKNPVEVEGSELHNLNLMHIENIIMYKWLKKNSFGNSIIAYMPKRPCQVKIQFFPSSTFNINEGKKSTNIFDMPIDFRMCRKILLDIFFSFSVEPKMFYRRFIGGAGL